MTTPLSLKKQIKEEPSSLWIPTFIKKKVLEQLNDEEYYKQITNNPDKATKKRLKKLIKDYNQCLTEKEIAYLCDFDPKESNFYGLPKVHKSAQIQNTVRDQNNIYVETFRPADLKLRPIIAGPESLTQRLSHFIDLVIKHLCPSIPSYIKDDMEFLNHIPAIVPEETLLTSFDVTSLYTNIPHDLGLTAVKYWIEEKRDEIDSRFETNFILEATKIVLEENTFYFDGNKYRQIKGTAMGTKVAPTYANLVMGYLEQQIYFTGVVTQCDCNLMWLVYLQHDNQFKVESDSRCAKNNKKCPIWSLKTFSALHFLWKYMYFKKKKKLSNRMEFFEALLSRLYNGFIDFHINLCAYKEQQAMDYFMKRACYQMKGKCSIRITGVHVGADVLQKNWYQSPPFVLNQQTEDNGDDLILSVMFYSIPSDFNIQWVLGNNTLNGDPEYSITENSIPVVLKQYNVDVTTDGFISNLTIHNFKRHPSDDYSCQISNSYGLVVEKFVLGQASLEFERRTYCDTSHSIELKCTLKLRYDFSVTFFSIPFPSDPKWYYNNEPVALGTKFLKTTTYSIVQIRQHRVLINEEGFISNLTVHKAEYGLYKCVILNSFGEMNQLFLIEQEQNTFSISTTEATTSLDSTGNSVTVIIAICSSVFGIAIMVICIILFIRRISSHKSDRYNSTMPTRDEDSTYDTIRMSSTSKRSGDQPDYLEVF
ncbi:unnamed protein product [Mytilus edulis]|uniref:Ig-like domain-containing protein n=1 Tax=Mytilus edulis TaxID=6550 RepID=A0A8S3S3H8_MYTED|nr:unnamed protein product [Mytilus edulis]